MCCIWLFAIFIMVVLNTEFEMVRACFSSQSDAHEPRSEDSNEVEIYFENSNPDKCNYGEWSKGADIPRYYRKMDYKGVIVASKNNSDPIKTLVRLMEVVKETAKMIGANLVCGGRIYKIPPANNVSYEFIGTGLRSCSGSIEIVYFLLPTMMCILFWMNSII
jgi:hypothetical protein